MSQFVPGPRQRAFQRYYLSEGRHWTVFWPWGKPEKRRLCSLHYQLQSQNSSTHTDEIANHRDLPSHSTLPVAYADHAAATCSIHTASKFNSSFPRSLLPRVRTGPEELKSFFPTARAYHPGSHFLPKRHSHTSSTPDFTSTSGTVELSEPEIAQRTEASGDTQLLDLDFIQRNHPLPTKAEYPEADPNLFTTTGVSIAIHNSCQRYKNTPLRIDFDYEPKKGLTKDDLNKIHPGLSLVHLCSFKLDVQGVCEAFATGEGTSKLLAKQAAWLNAVTQMHADGRLRTFYNRVILQVDDDGLSSKTKPDQEIDSQPSSSGQIAEKFGRSVNTDSVHRPAAGFETELSPAVNAKSQATAVNVVSTADTKLDEEDVTDANFDEFDSEVQCYNYAASAGMVPVVTIKSVRLSSPRLRRAKVAKPRPQFVRVNLEVAELDLVVTALEKTPDASMSSAVFKFLQKLEELRNAVPEKFPSAENDFSNLSTHTAKRFFETYKRHKKGLRLEIEHEQISGPGLNHRASVIVNGRELSKAVNMTTKRRAVDVAFLTAAVQVARAEPDILSEFNEVISNGGLGPIRPVQVTLDIEWSVLKTMREGLVQARTAGLPDNYQSIATAVSGMRQVSKASTTSIPSETLEEQNRCLLEKQQQLLSTSPPFVTLRSKKEALPIYAHRDDLRNMISGNTYSIIIGATGSGKTSQIPQIIFEDAVDRGLGSICNVICTQPRRLATVALGRRVASERNEKIGEIVGYQVRFDSQLPRSCFGITFCTTGILLQRLRRDLHNTLNTVSHIIIDEVHERDSQIDLVMILLKTAIEERQAKGLRVPKVILMSATLDPELFSQFFKQIMADGSWQACPTLNVSGRMFPVEERYFGSIVHDLEKSHTRAIESLLRDDRKSFGYFKSECAFDPHLRKVVSKSSGDHTTDPKQKATVKFAGDGEIAGLLEEDDTLVPSTLVAITIEHICNTSHGGAILVFLPGLEEILEVEKILLERTSLGLDFKDTSKYRICHLHSSLPNEKQSEIFATFPGCRKIILSTNIAETSVTVPDVKHVVDTGKLREGRYNHASRMTRLQCVWQSKSNQKQRAGRAGRVQEGLYYAMFTKKRADSFREVGQPELLRTDLQTTCLSIKAQNVGERVQTFLARAIEPPPAEAVDNAVKSLIRIGALSNSEEITVLGRILAELPLSPIQGKMVILGVLFRCLDPMLIIAAAAACRPLFLDPIGNRIGSRNARKSFAGAQPSDHISILNAFKELRSVQVKQKANSTRSMDRQEFVNITVHREIKRIARQIEDILVTSSVIKRPIRQTNRGVFGPPELNINSENLDVVKALLVAGLSPNLAATRHGTFSSCRTARDSFVLAHSNSVLADKKAFDLPESSLLTHSGLEKNNNSGAAFVRHATKITPLMAVLFCNEIELIPKGSLVVENWLHLKNGWYDQVHASKLVFEYRKALDRILALSFGAVANRSQGPAIDVSLRDDFIKSIAKVLSHDSATT